MNKILFINACVRENSRTLKLAQTLIDKKHGTLTQINLQDCSFAPLDRERLKTRDALIARGKLSDKMFFSAHEFANADEIIIAAPYWDLGFPAILKTYLENIMVSGITFSYENGVPASLCKAKRLYYVTTSGGPITTDFGFEYIKALCECFFGITDTVCYNAQCLDMYNTDTDKLISKTQQQIINDTK